MQRSHDRPVVPIPQAFPKGIQCTDGVGWGLVVPLQDLLQNLFVQRQFSHSFLQSAILTFKFFHALGLVDFHPTMRPLKNVHFCSSSRKAIILSIGIYWVFRGLQFEPDLKIGQKGAFAKVSSDCFRQRDNRFGLFRNSQITAYLANRQYPWDRLTSASRIIRIVFSGENRFRFILTSFVWSQFLV